PARQARRALSPTGDRDRLKQSQTFRCAAPTPSSGQSKRENQKKRRTRLPQGASRREETRPEIFTHPRGSPKTRASKYGFPQGPFSTGAHSRAASQARRSRTERKAGSSYAASRLNSTKKTVMRRRMGTIGW